MVCQHHSRYFCLVVTRLCVLTMTPVAARLSHACDQNPDAA